jgi:hypothetical protein
MNGLFNPCGRYRHSLCLLAGGVLPARARDRLEHHLAVCADCREYLAELESVTTSLANWEEDFAHVQPGPAARSRWARAVKAAGRSVGNGSPGWVRQPTPAVAISEWWHEVIWPYRRIWAGLALAWVMILTGHLSLRDPSQTLALKSSPPSQAMIMALRDRQTILADLLSDHSAPREAERPKVFSPKPRTERVRILTT